MLKKANLSAKELLNPRKASTLATRLNFVRVQVSLTTAFSIECFSQGFCF